MEKSNMIYVAVGLVIFIILLCKCGSSEKGDNIVVQAARTVTGQKVERKSKKSTSMSLATAAICTVLGVGCYQYFDNGALSGENPEDSKSGFITMIMGGLAAAILPFAIFTPARQWLMAKVGLSNPIEKETEPGEGQDVIVSPKGDNSSASQPDASTPIVNPLPQNKPGPSNPINRDGNQSEDGTKSSITSGPAISSNSSQSSSQNKERPKDDEAATGTPSPTSQNGGDPASKEDKNTKQDGPAEGVGASKEKQANPISPAGKPPRNPDQEDPENNNDQNEADSEEQLQKALAQIAHMERPPTGKLAVQPKKVEKKPAKGTKSKQDDTSDDKRNDEPAAVASPVPLEASAAKVEETHSPAEWARIAALCNRGRARIAAEKKRPASASQNHPPLEHGDGEEATVKPAPSQKPSQGLEWNSKEENSLENDSMDPFETNAAMRKRRRLMERLVRSESMTELL